MSAATVVADASSSLPACMFMLQLIAPRQEGNILKISQPEEHSIAEPRMRAEDLRVMTKGWGGRGTTANNKTN